MNRWWGRWVLVGTMALGGSALAQEGVPGEPHQPPREQQRAFPMLTDEMARAMVAPTLVGFLEQLHHLNRVEMALGEFTQQKAWSSEVQEYGEYLYQQHRQADQMLMQLARQNEVRIGEAEPINDFQRRLQAHQMAMKAMLAVLQGPLYDQQFLASQVVSHNHALALAMAGREIHPQLAPLLDQLIPMLREHRQRAYQLLEETMRLPALPQAQQQQQPAQRRQARPPAGERR